MAIDPDDYHPKMQPDPPTWVTVAEASHEVVLDGDPDDPEEDDPAMREEIEHQREMMHDVRLAEWQEMMDRIEEEKGKC